MFKLLKATSPQGPAQGSSVVNKIKAMPPRERLAFSLQLRQEYLELTSLLEKSNIAHKNVVQAYEGFTPQERQGRWTDSQLKLLSEAMDFLRFCGDMARMSYVQLDQALARWFMSGFRSQESEDYAQFCAEDYRAVMTNYADVVKEVRSVLDLSMGGPLSA